MRRTITACLAAGLLLSACAPGGEAPESGVTISVWSNFADRELEALQQVLDRFHQKHPDITIDLAGNQDDDKITQAIRGGIPPDVALASTPDNVGQYCSSGAWQDLGPYLKRDNVDLGQIPKAVRDYTQYQGTRCAMPLLTDTYGLYYNKDLFAKAGLRRPPKTMSELAGYAKKLTERNPDGSIKVAGFVPQMFFYQNHPPVWAPLWGARWLDGNGNSTLATDPGWRKMFRWQKELVDFYGWEDLQRFTSRQGLYSAADQAFHTGEVAMAFDGEYRTAFIEDQAPGLNYGTAPAPVSDDRAHTYGAGYVTGTVIGIPRGTEHPDAAWKVLKYLTTDTDALVRLANTFGNVPSTFDSVRSPELETSEQFQTFIDIFNNPHAASSPASPNGPAYIKSVEDFFQAWQTGAVDDLQGGLAELDRSIDAAKSLGK